MPLKRLYSFNVSKTIEEDVEKIIKNSDGTETKIKEKESRKQDFRFFLRKPARALRDDAELFKGNKYSEAIKNNLLPAALVSKRLINDEGIFSEKEKQEHDTLKIKLFELQASLAKSYLVPEKERNEEQKKEVEDLIKELGTTRNQLSKYEALQLSIYDNTVEVYVRNKTIFFYALFLAYKDENGKETPFFGENTKKNWEANYNFKLEEYDKYEDQNDSFINKVINKFLHIATIWFVTGEEDEVELKKLIDPADETDAKILPP